MTINYQRFGADPNTGLMAPIVQAAQDSRVADAIRAFGSKVLVLHQSDPIPPGTPINTVIFRIS